jgi:pimeloyl-ACP methyl ester carboxylesterase
VTPATFAVAGVRLEYRWIGPGPERAPTIVFLHEGLGCVAAWRDFPDRLARATGCGALVYSRRGYGASDPVREPRSVRFMHDEALEVLPAALAHFAIERPIVFGHSDGASIALIHAAGAPARARALILEAPHVFVEPLTLDSIARVARTARTTGLFQRLARYHGANTRSMLRSWTGVWLRPEFRSWSIEDCLPAVECPLLVVQGRDDEYGTTAQVDRIVSLVKGRVETLWLDACGHAPHRDRPEEVIAVSVPFVADVQTR